jgi:hypothetical protein
MWANEAVHPQRLILDLKIGPRILPWLAILFIAVAYSGLQATVAGQTVTRTQDVQLYTGDTLIVQSDTASIQQVFMQGNLSATNFTRPTHSPTSEFEIQAFNASSFELRFIFNYPTDYQVNLLTKPSDLSAFGNNNTTYYLSGGEFELDVNANFNARPDSPATVAASVPPWDSFVGWIGKFGQAFPLWVKALYFALGVQFLAVGGIWIGRESKRKESAGQRFDIGDKAYLWLDVVYKFLVVSFAAIVAIMGGELLLLFVLRFMFLASVNLLSLWDLFVVGFAVGAIIIVYCLKFTLEKAFDLKPMVDE